MSDSVSTAPTETTSDPQRSHEPTKSKLLVGRELWLYRIGLACLIAAVVALVLLVLVFVGPFHRDFLTFDGALQAVGAILGAVATTFAAIGSALLFVVSLRVQARELQNSIRELRFSVEAQQAAAANHKQALAVAERELQVVRQEKEFNVCLQAISEVRSNLAEFQIQSLRGVRALDYITAEWTVNLMSIIGGTNRLVADALRGRSYNISAVLPEYDNIIGLRIKLYWVLDSVLDDSPFNKGLDPRDAAYIRALIIPLVEDCSAAIDRHVSRALEDAEILLGSSDEYLELLGVARQGVLMVKGTLLRVRETATERGYTLSTYL